MTPPALDRLRGRLHDRLHDRLRGRLGADEGATLMELLVGMAVMLVFLTIFTTAMTMMSRSESKTRAVSDASAQVNAAFLWFDKQVRYAAAISAPGASSPTTASGDWYVELRNTGDGTQRCTQVRLDIATNQLQRRTWQVTGTSAGGLSAWTPIAGGFTNTATTPDDPADKPFVSAARATGSEIAQQLRITLVAAGGGGSSATSTRSSFSFTAVNSSMSTTGSTVCQEAGRP